MSLPPEVLASIVKVAGDWALGMASSPEPSGEPIQPRQMSGELEEHFNFAFNYLANYINDYLSTSK